MGKLARKKSSDIKTDEHQRKISSFFGNKSKDEKTTSQLFTSIESAGKTNPLITPSFDSRQKSSSSSKQLSSRAVIHIIEDDESDQKETSSSMTTKKFHLTKEKGLISYGGVKSKTKEEGHSYSDSSMCGKSRFIPVDDLNCKDRDENDCLILSDDVSTPSKSTQDFTGSSPDIICSTPGVDSFSGTASARIKGKAVGRSFLRPFHLLSEQPDLKAAALRINPKRRVAKPKLPVSVEFNPNSMFRSSNESKDLSNKCEREFAGYEKCLIDAKLMSQTLDEKGEMNIEMENCGASSLDSLEMDDKRNNRNAKGCQMKDISCIDNFSDQFASRCVQPVPIIDGVLRDTSKVERIECEVECNVERGEGIDELELDFSTDEPLMPTPTKVDHNSDVVDVTKIKRQAKPGLSPCSKLSKMNDENQLYVESKLEKVKRNFNPDKDMALLQRNSDNYKSKNLTMVQNNKSQKFSVKKSEELGWKGTTKVKKEEIAVTLEDDGLLEELMKGLEHSCDFAQGNKTDKLAKNKKKRKSLKSNDIIFSDINFKTDSRSSMTVDEVSLGMVLPQEVMKEEFAVSDSLPVGSDRMSERSPTFTKKAVSFEALSDNKSTLTMKPKPKHPNSSNRFECASNDINDTDYIDAVTHRSKVLSSNVNINCQSVSLPSVPKKVSSTDLNSSEDSFRFTDLWQRFIVDDVIHDSHADETYVTLSKGRDHSAFHYCTLQGFWVDSKINEGDIVHIIGQFDDNNSCTLDDKSGMIVISPDLLLSGTSVVSSVFCSRKSVLNEKFKGLDQGNTHMLYGSIIHSLFQAVVKDNIRHEGEIIHVAKSLLAGPKFLHLMYGQQVTEGAVMDEIRQYIPPLKTWMAKHMADDKRSAAANRSDVVVTSIQDIEENIWSPRFGLKGKIDLTIKAKLRDKNGSADEKIVPLELKTGKASFSSEHKGQVTLYSTMYGDRHGDPGEGLLLYLKHDQMESVPVNPQCQSGLMQLRNSLASFLKGQITRVPDDSGHVTYSLGRLPKPINNQRACTQCSHLLNCCIYQRSIEKVESTLPGSHPMTRLVPETLSHLNPDDLDYFQHWVTCLTMEGDEVNQRQTGHIWTMTSQERERKGDCISRLSVQSSELGIQESQGFNEGKGCSLTFVRHRGCQDIPLDSIGLTANDAVVVSSEDGRFIALTTGFIRTMSSKHVEVVVDRDNLYDISKLKNMIFRVDRNSSFSTTAQLMVNLTRLMEKSTAASKLRDLIIRKRQPQYLMQIPMRWVRTMKPVFEKLNKPQKKAVLKVIMASDYTLIRGFPGTGKTSTIVALVKVLHLLNMSVLLTSYTHSAVDNILMKLKEDDVPFLRLGRQARIHPTILPHAADILTSRIPTVEALKEFYNSYSVVATSCLGVTHSIFNHRCFDVCIVDEASQVLQAACVGPLLHCQKFVLVGDGKQLAPVVQSKEAKSLGMDESLFSRLEDAGATFDLNLQYRMNEVIMRVSNSLVYDGQLCCGNQNVAERCLKVELSHLETCQDWIKESLCPELSKSVVFLDTQKVPNCDSSEKEGHGTRSDLEVGIVIKLLESLHKASVTMADVGVMSPYRSQVKFIQCKIQSCPLVADVEVNTIDQYQGRDKYVIIVSFALSEDRAGDSAGELLKDIRRLNVALTRAKCKLILVGNFNALQDSPHLRRVMTDLGNNGCMIELPPNSLTQFNR